MIEFKSVDQMWHLCSCDAVVLSYLHRGLHLFFSSSNIVSTELLPLLWSCGTANKNEKTKTTYIIYFIKFFTNILLRFYLFGVPS